MSYNFWGWVIDMVVAGVVSAVMFDRGRAYERKKRREEEHDKLWADAVGRDEPKF